MAQLESLGLSPEQLRAAGYAHRLAVAARFADRIAAGDAVFMSPTKVSAQPVTVSAGNARHAIAGINRWVLMQAMRDQGWTDPRFFTPSQITAMGWSLPDSAQESKLQFVDAVDAAGVARQVPVVKQFDVFNASEVQGAGDDSGRHRLSPQALERAMMANDFEPGLDLGSALSEWVNTRLRVGHAAGGGPRHRLTQAMATTIVAAQLDLGNWWVDGEPLDTADRSMVEQLVRNEPGAFFDAIRESELVAAELLTHVRLAEQQNEVDAVLRHPSTDGRSPSPTHNEEPAMLNRATPEHASKPQPADKQSASRDAYLARLDERFAEREAVLAVPFAEKERASALGAVWYGRQHVWFVPKGVDVTKFKEWDPREISLGATAAESEIIDSFCKEMEAMGLDTSKGIVADGAWHNVRVFSKKGSNRSGAYILSLDGGKDRSAIGSINNKYSGESRSWTFDGPLLTPEQKARMRAEAARRAEVADRQVQSNQAQAAIHAVEIVRSAEPAGDHPYLTKKGIPPEGLFQVAGDVLLEYEEFVGESGKSAIRKGQQYLVVPMRSESGEIRAVQAISEDGSVKSFMRGAQKKGLMAVLGAASHDAICQQAAARSEPVDVGYVEGFATGASLRRPTGMPVVVCFDAGNLEVVAAKAARSLPPNAHAAIAVDNDQFHVERALGFLAANLGVNPNSQRGSVVEVLSGAGRTRLVSLGDAIADGEWNQAPRGRYRMDIEREPDSTEVRAIKVEVLLDDGKKMQMAFSNRGAEAGRNVLAAFADLAMQDTERGHAQAAVLTPVFRNLAGRPTDWNDLEQAEGQLAVARQVRATLQPGELREPSRATPQHIASRGIER
jgi:phage/plasmid primase-like uncharacterized protein